MPTDEKELVLAHWKASMNLRVGGTLFGKSVRAACAPQAAFLKCLGLLENHPFKKTLTIAMRTSRCATKCTTICTSIYTTISTTKSTLNNVTVT